MKVRLGKDPERDLIAIARAYAGFTNRNALLWGVFFEHRLPEGKVLPDWYHERVYRLYGLIETVLEPLFDARQKKKKRHIARVIWGSLHGIMSLSRQDKMGGENSAQLAETMITNFVRGLLIEKAT